MSRHSGATARLPMEIVAIPSSRLIRRARILRQAAATRRLRAPTPHRAAATRRLPALTLLQAAATVAGEAAAVMVVVAATVVALTVAEAPAVAGPTVAVVEARIVVEAGRMEAAEAGLTENKTISKHKPVRISDGLSFFL